MSYMTLSSQENTYFYSFHSFTHIRQHYFSKYWGGRMHGPFPHLKLWGTVPPVPPRFPPLLLAKFSFPSLLASDSLRLSVCFPPSLPPPLSLSLPLCIHSS